MDSGLYDIKKGVVENGFHEEYWLILLNTALRSTGDKTGEQQLKEWCSKEGLTFEIFDVPIPGKKNKTQQKLRFRKAGT